MVALKMGMTVRTFVEIEQFPGMVLGISSPGTYACLLAISDKTTLSASVLYAADASTPKSKRSRSFAAEIQVRLTMRSSCPAHDDRFSLVIKAIQSSNTIVRLALSSL